MALSFVGSASNSAINGNDVTVTLPSMAEDDVVYVIGGNDSGDDPTVSTTGYTDLHSNISSPQTIVARKVQGATPDSSVVIDGGGHTFAAVGAVAHVWRGVDQTTPEDAATVRVLDDSDPDSASITTVTDGAVVLTLFGSEDTDAIITAPSGYENQEDVTENDEREITVGVASKVIASAGAEDPGAWTTDFSLVASYAAYTVAIRPAADEGASGTGSQTVPDVAQAASAAMLPDGDGAQNAAAPTQAATGAESFTGSAATSIPAPGQTASALHAGPVAGAAAQQVAARTQAVLGGQVENLAGSAAQAAAAPSQAAAGVEAFAGAGTQSRAAVSQAASALHAGPVAATVAQTIAAPAQAALGGQVENLSGSGAQALAPATQDSLGGQVESIAGSAAQALAALSQAASSAIVLPEPATPLDGSWAPVAALAGGWGPQTSLSGSWATVATLAGGFAPAASLAGSWDVTAELDGSWDP